MEEMGEMEEKGIHEVSCVSAVCRLPSPSASCEQQRCE